LFVLLGSWVYDSDFLYDIAMYHNRYSSCLMCDSADLLIVTFYIHRLYCYIWSIKLDFPHLKCPCLLSDSDVLTEVKNVGSARLLLISTDQQDRNEKDVHQRGKGQQRSKGTFLG
jgi:hypothetical protein